LYGSVARKQADQSSDIDLLVLLNQPFDYFRKLRQIVDLLYPIQLESDRLISALPAADQYYDFAAFRAFSRPSMLRAPSCSAKDWI
jgi:predicted nucleotidyltransferase